MTIYRLPNAYRYALIPFGIILFASCIISFGNLFGNWARLIFAGGTIYLLHKYLVLIHAVAISDGNTVRINSLLRERTIPGNDLLKIEDYDFFIKVAHNNGTFTLICLFARYAELKNHLKRMNTALEFVGYNKAGENADKIFLKFIKHFIRLIRWF
jgi:hypothetical protein